MKKKVKKLELKKLIQEYNYLLTDETYKQEVVSETKSDFLKEVHNKRVDLGLIKDEPYTPENDNNNNKKEEGSKGEEGNEAEDNKQNSNSED